MASYYDDWNIDHSSCNDYDYIDDNYFVGDCGLDYRKTDQNDYDDRDYGDRACDDEDLDDHFNVAND